jgi:hypothetical protein
MRARFDEARLRLDQGPRNGSTARFVDWADIDITKERDMREHSGAEGGKNNSRNPTMKDAEAAKGRSGEAIQGSKKKQAQPSRKSTAQPG